MFKCCVRRVLSRVTYAAGFDNGIEFLAPVGRCADDDEHTWSFVAEPNIRIDTIGPQEQKTAPKRRYMLALDLGLREILPDGGGFWNWMRQTLDHFKQPSPAIEFGETKQLYLVFPFGLRIGDIRL